MSLDVVVAQGVDFVADRSDQMLSPRPLLSLDIGDALARGRGIDAESRRGRGLGGELVDQVAELPPAQNLATVVASPEQVADVEAEEAVEVRL